MTDIYARQRIAQQRQRQQTDIAQLERQRQQALESEAETRRQQELASAAETRAQQEQELVSAQETEADKQIQKEVTEFEQNNVKLDTDEWISRSNYEKLTSAQQKTITKLGTKEYNRLLSDIEGNATEIKDKFPELWTDVTKDAIYIPPQDYLLPPMPRDVSIEGAVPVIGTSQELRKEVPREMLVARGGHIWPGDEKQPTWVVTTKSGFVSKEYWDSLGIRGQNELMARGIDNFEAWLADPSTPHPSRGNVYIYTPSPSIYDMTVVTPQGQGIVSGGMFYPSSGGVAQPVQFGTPEASSGGRWSPAGKAAIEQMWLAAQPKTDPGISEIRDTGIDIPQSTEAKKVVVGNNISITPSSRQEYVSAYIEQHGSLPPDQQLKQAGYNTDYDSKLALAMPILRSNLEKSHIERGGAWWPKDDWKNLPQDAQNAANESIATYNKWVSDNYFKTKAGEMVGVGFYNNLPAESQKIVNAGGLQALQDNQVRIAEDMKPYEQQNGYDIARYLRDKPSGDSDLEIIGFGKKDIEAAQSYNQQPHVRTTPLESFITQVSKQTGGKYGSNLLIDQKAADAFKNDHPVLFREYNRIGVEYTKEQMSGKHPEAPVSLNQFVVDFMDARGVEPVPLEIIGLFKGMTPEQQAVRTMAVQEYSRLYGQESRVKSVGIDTAATFIASPIRALHPEVGVSNITPMEWGIGAAQVSLIALPGIGAAAGRAGGAAAATATTRSIQAAGGIMFTASTIKDWDKMSVAERVISVAIDTMILAGAAVKVKPVTTKTAAAMEKGLTELSKGMTMKNPKAIGRGKSILGRAGISGQAVDDTVASYNRANAANNLDPINTTEWRQGAAVPPQPEGNIGRYGLYLLEQTPDNIAAERASIDRIVARGSLKDVGSITNQELITYAKSKGLKVEAHPYGDDFWYVRRATDTAKDKVQQLTKLETELKSGNYTDLELHRKIGRLYDYSESDINAYIANQQKVGGALKLASALIDASRQAVPNTEATLQKFKAISADTFDELASKGKVKPYASIDDEIKAVTEGRKPILSSLDSSQWAKIKASGLKTMEIPSAELNRTQLIGYMDDKVANAMKGLSSKYGLGSVSPTELLGNPAYHIEFGSLLGYTDADIAAFLKKQVPDFKQLQSKLTGIGNNISTDAAPRKIKLDSFKGRTEIDLPEATITQTEIIVKKGAPDIYVNGEKVKGRAPLNYGDYVRIGDTGIAFIPEEVSMAAMAAKADEFKAAATTKRMSDKVASVTGKPVVAREMEAAITTINRGISRRDVKLIKAGARQLLLVGRKMPKQLGGGAVTKKAQLLLKAPEEYLQLGKGKSSGTKPPIDDIDQKIRDNEKFIDDAERALRRAKKPETKTKLKEAIKTAKKQVQVAEREKTERKWIISPEEWRTGKPSEPPAKIKTEPLAKTTTRELVVIREKPKVGQKPETKPKAKSTLLEKSRVKTVRQGEEVTWAVAPGEKSPMPLAIPYETYIWERGVIKKGMPTSVPMEVGQIVTSTTTKPITLVQQQLAAKTMLKTQTKTMAETATKLKGQVETKLATMPATKPAHALSLAAKPVTKQQTKERAKLAPYPTPTPRPTTKPPVAPIKPGDPKKPPPPPPPLLPEKIDVKNLTKKQREGAIAWKQGLFYKSWFPPYNDGTMVTTREPVIGVQYHAGVGSAAKSIVAKFGNIPPQLHYDMGIQDITIFKTRNPKKPRIHFKRDIKQATSSTGIITTK